MTKTIYTNDLIGHLFLGPHLRNTAKGTARFKGGLTDHLAEPTGRATNRKRRRGKALFPFGVTHLQDMMMMMMIMMLLPRSRRLPINEKRNCMMTIMIALTKYLRMAIQMTSQTLQTSNWNPSCKTSQPTTEMASEGQSRVHGWSARTAISYSIQRERFLISITSSRDHME